MESYQFSFNGDSGKVILPMQSPCGLKPIIGWRGLDELRDFADMLLNFYWRNKINELEIRYITDDILSRAFSKDELADW